MTAEEKVAKALEHIMVYGGIDGGHHKQWVLDQLVRILTDCPKVEKTANDFRGNPYTYEGLGESEEYLSWVKEHDAGEDGPETYSWDEGMAP